MGQVYLADPLVRLTPGSEFFITRECYYFMS